MNNGQGAKKHTIAVLVENKFGVLSRVAGLFTPPGRNNQTPSLGGSAHPPASRRTPGGRGAGGGTQRVRAGKVAIARGSETARRRTEERLGKTPDGAPGRRRREEEGSRDPRIAGFVD